MFVISFLTIKENENIQIFMDKNINIPCHKIDKAFYFFIHYMILKSLLLLEKKRIDNTV